MTNNRSLTRRRSRRLNPAEEENILNAMYSNAVEIFMSPTMEDQATPRPEQVSLLGLHDGDVNVFKFVTVTGTKV